MNKKKEYIEPEIINNDSKKFSKKSIKFGGNFAEEKINENFSGIKKQILVKGIFFLLPYVFIFLGFFVLIFWIIFIIFDKPFDYIISGILLYFILKSAWKIFRFFSIKK